MIPYHRVVKAGHDVRSCASLNIFFEVGRIDTNEEREKLSIWTALVYQHNMIVHEISRSEFELAGKMSKRTNLARTDFIKIHNIDELKQHWDEDIINNYNFNLNDILYKGLGISSLRKAHLHLWKSVNIKSLEIFIGINVFNILNYVVNILYIYFVVLNHYINILKILYKQLKELKIIMNIMLWLKE